MIFCILFQAADIWSLGITLYTLVIGDIPLHDDNILALYHKIKTQPIEFTDDQKLKLSPEIRDLIIKMLIKDPAQRITLDDIKVFIILLNECNNFIGT